MKRKLFKTMIAAASVAMICACGDDSASNSDNSIGAGSSASVDPLNPSSDSQSPQDPCSGVVVLSDAWIVNIGTSVLVVYPDGAVTDAMGTLYGVFDGEKIIDAAGNPVVEIPDVLALTGCKANASIDPQSGEIVMSSSSAANPLDPNNPQNPTSSAGDSTNPTSSDSTVPTSSEGSATTESSASNDPEIGPDGFPTIESYGPPPPEYTKNILDNGQTGWNSRYWDACKPHCSWISNGQEGKTDTTTQESYVAGMTTARNCNIHDVEVPTFTLGHAVQQYWMGYEGTTSACEVGAAGVFTCTDMAPIALNDTLSYAYVAGPGSQTTCGKCFHLQYNGSFKDAGANNAAKATHKALKGKHIIVMTSNIGHDVENGQFDLMVPGGGVGAYDALSTQVNGANINWGAGFGGFLTECQGKLGYDNTLEKYQQCVRDM